MVRFRNLTSFAKIGFPHGNRENIFIAHIAKPRDSHGDAAAALIGMCIVGISRNNARYSDIAELQQVLQDDFAVWPGKTASIGRPQAILRLFLDASEFRQLVLARHGSGGRAQRSDGLGARLCRRPLILGDRGLFGAPLPLGTLRAYGFDYLRIT